MENESVYLRPLEENEWNLLYTMRLLAFKEAKGSFYADAIAKAKSREESYWKALLTKEGNRFWGLFDNHRCIGLTGITVNKNDDSGRSGVLGFDYIDEKYRGKGFSNLFYGPRIQHARECNWKKLTAIHREGNVQPHRALIQHGFDYKPGEETQWGDDEHKVTKCIHIRDLGR